MDDVRLTIIFCEDVRIEEGGKPMILGMLAPTFYSGLDDGEPDALTVVTIFTAPPHVKEVTAELTVTRMPREGEATLRKVSRTMQRPDNASESDDWTIMLPLSLQDNTFEDGARVHAVFKAGGKETHASVRMIREEFSDE